MGFGCTKCGACCIKARDILKGQLFPYQFLENGQCEKYDPVVGCTVYHSRPAACNIEIGYDIYNALMPMEKETYYDISALNCNRWMNDLKIDESFRITKKN